MKLFTKYNRFNLTVMAMLFIASGVTYYVLISNVLIHEVDEALGKYKDQVEKYVSRHDSLPVFKNFEEVQVKYHQVDKAHKEKVSQVQLYDPEEQKTDAFRQIVFTEKVQGKWYEIVVAKPLEGTKLLIKTVAYSTSAILLVIIAISILLNQIILRKLWRPFYATMNEMKRFKLGSKQEPVFSATDIEEFSFMNQSLSAVITAAKDDYRILKEFTENASHETQTPLAIIRSKLDLVIQEEGLSEEQSTALKSAYAAVHRLSKLNQSLLLLAKIENQQFAGTELIDMNQKIQEKLFQFNEFWAGNNIKVHCELQPAVIIANPELIDILLNNLLSNAGRHNVDGGEISIALSPGRLEIANTAKYNSLDTKKLFSRFYKEAQHSSKHNGLGLSIVKEIGDHSGISISYDFRDQYHHFIFEWKA